MNHNWIVIDVPTIGDFKTFRCVNCGLEKDDSRLNVFYYDVQSRSLSYGKYYIGTTEPSCNEFIARQILK